MWKYPNDWYEWYMKSLVEICVGVCDERPHSIIW